mmetsp:Transcript_46491/g.74754  ORF Transcript_46491/g.74754 Transcript_46491/m.74754 type:complete len:197 (+) Transcript_46491:13-603(+)
MANVMETENVPSSSASPEIKLKEVNLYGGTFRAKIPESMKDVSEMRQVPNHQEFYADLQSGLSTIVEMNEHQKQVKDEAAAAFFFENLAKDNDAKAATISKQGSADIPSFKEYFTAYAIGDHLVKERIDNKGPQLRVRVHMAVIRLKKVTTDLLMILSYPVKNEISEKESTKLESTFMAMMKSFEIRSWAVFKGSG